MANIVLTGKKTEGFPPKIRNKTRMSALTTSTLVLEVLASTIR